jgi:hypothetical protein
MSMIVISAKAGIQEARVPCFIAKQPEYQGRSYGYVFSAQHKLMTSLATNHPDIFKDERLTNMLRQELTNII